MKKAVVFAAVIASLALASYFFVQSYSTSRDITSAVTLPPVSEKSQAFTLAIVFFSVAVASLFYYLSLQQKEQGQRFGASRLPPDKTEATVSADDVVVRLTGPEQPKAREKARYFVSEDFSQAGNKNRF